MLNQKEKVLLSIFLEESAEERSNHMCNDVDQNLFKDWTEEEICQLNKEIHDWNNSADEERESNLYLYDWALISFLADKLMEK